MVDLENHRYDSFQGLQEGLQKGERQGQANRASTVVRNMFARSFSAEDAGGIAEVELEEVNQWLAEWSGQ